ncbi:MAG: hypothetical protein WCJ86_02585 [Candidatus Saccharibacteria bacterium]
MSELDPIESPDILIPGRGTSSYVGLEYTDGGELPVPDKLHRLVLWGAVRLSEKNINKSVKQGDLIKHTSWSLRNSYPVNTDHTMTAKKSLSDCMIDGLIDYSAPDPHDKISPAYYDNTSGSYNGSSRVQSREYKITPFGLYVAAESARRVAVAEDTHATTRRSALNIHRIAAGRLITSAMEDRSNI